MVVGAGHLEPRNSLYFQVLSFTSAVKSSITLIRPQAISSLYLETMLHIKTPNSLHFQENETENPSPCMRESPKILRTA